MDAIDKILQRKKVRDQEAVGGFAIDSFPEVPPPPEKKRKRQIIMSVYPESKDMSLKKRAMIDLDLTIHKYSDGYKDGEMYDEPFSGAKEVINWLKNQGYEIVIFTTRASKENSKENGGDYNDQIKKVTDWLNKHNIYFDRITGEKLAADFYIDDKAIHIPNGDWKTVLKIIKKRIKYNVA